MDNKRIFLILTLLFSTVLVGAALISIWNIDNHGSVKSINCKVYEDLALTTELHTIDWGVIEPGEVKTKNAYVYLNGNADASLMMYVTNYNPVHSGSYLAVTWDISGTTTYTAGSVIPVIITLDADGGTTGFIDFSFDITIEASG